MHIHWGKKIERVAMGRVADFCAICHHASPQRLESVREKAHVNGIGLGAGTELHGEATCEVCGAIRPVSTERFCGVSRPRDNHTLVQLLEFSRPNLLEEYAERFRAEEHIRAGNAEARDRIEILEDIFRVADYTFQLRSVYTRYDPILIAIIVVAVGCGVGGIGLLAAGFQPHVGRWLLAAAAASYCALIPRVLLARPRVAKKVIVPMLGKALRPMRPSRGEIELGLQQTSPKLQKRISIEALEREIANTSVSER